MIAYNLKQLETDVAGEVARRYLFLRTELLQCPELGQDVDFMRRYNDYRRQYQHYHEKFRRNHSWDGSFRKDEHAFSSRFKSHFFTSQHISFARIREAMDGGVI